MSTHEGGSAEYGPDPNQQSNRPWNAWEVSEETGPPEGQGLPDEAAADAGYGTAAEEDRGSPTGYESAGYAGVEAEASAEVFTQGDPDHRDILWERPDPEPDHPAAPRPEASSSPDDRAPIPDITTLPPANPLREQGGDEGMGGATTKTPEGGRENGVAGRQEREAKLPARREAAQYLALEHPPAPNNQFEEGLRALDRRPQVELGGSADTETMLLAVIRLRQLRDVNQNQEVGKQSEADRIERVRSNPEEFPEVVTEEIAEPSGAWGELVAAKKDADKLVEVFAQQQGENLAALVGELNWTQQERQDMGLSHHRDRENRLLIIGVHASLTSAIGRGDPEQIAKAFQEVHEHIDGMAVEYEAWCRRPDSEATATGLVQPIRTEKTNDRHFRAATLEYAHSQRAGGTAEADRLLPNELARRAALLQEDARRMKEIDDPRAFMRGEGRGATPWELHIRRLWARGAALQFRAAGLNGSEPQSLEELTKLVTLENERRAELSDREQLGATSGTGGLGELSDARLGALIQGTAVNVLKLRQTEGAEATRSLLAVTSQKVQDLLKGRGSAGAKELTDLLQGVASGTLRIEELLTMHDDMVRGLAETATLNLSPSTDEQPRSPVATANFAMLTGFQAAAEHDADGTLTALRQQGVEGKASEVRRKVFPPDRRWLVVTGDYWKDDGRPDALLETAAASGQLVGLDGLGHNSPLKDSHTRNRLSQASGEKTRLTHLPLLAPGREWEFIAVEGDPSAAQINPDDLGKSLLSHIAPNGACAMPLNLTPGLEELNRKLINEIAPWYFDENATGEGMPFAGQFRWLPVLTSQIRLERGPAGLQFAYGHSNPRAGGRPPATLYLFRKKRDGTDSDLCQQLEELDREARLARQYTAERR